MRFITLMFSSKDQLRELTESYDLKGNPNCSPLSLHFKFFQFFFLGYWDAKIKAREEL